MSTRAHVEFDLEMNGIRLAVVREGGIRQVIQWPPLAVRVISDDAAAPNPDDWLRLPEDDARAIYEALADHFGHTGHDIRALRKDYESERGRVDRLINHLTAAREPR